MKRLKKVDPYNTLQSNGRLFNDHIQERFSSAKLDETREDEVKILTTWINYGREMSGGAPAREKGLSRSLSLYEHYRF